MKWREVKTVLNDKSKDANEIKSKDIHYNGKAGDDVWFRVLGLKEEG